MFLRKSILVGMITFPLFPGVAMADPNSAVLEVAIQTLRHCYEIDHKVQAEVAACMSAKMKELPNPEHFNVHLSGDIPGELGLMLYSQTGYTTKCVLYAGRVIAVRQCISYQGPPLTDNQEISITPPN
ncbi:hypothetical protein [Legionella tunisiensis]|uniref:hypothetical protein n=1 Tax=Legionella tunisiensis TaxID=1034944 RepID=UPI0002E6D857|nr:hypothetical protein [Legionella tunisiensis]